MDRSPWIKVPVEKLFRATFGRTEKAWRHKNTDALLLLHRPRSRNGKWARRIGIWCVVCNGSLVRRRAVYGRAYRGLPWRWAGRVLRHYETAANGQTCLLVDGRRPTVAESLKAMPVHFDELPAVLIGQNRHGKQESIIPMPDDPQVPSAVPTVPPERTITGRFARCVLSREEYILYVQTWRQWVIDHPEYNTVHCRGMLADLCMTEVRMYRLAQQGRLDFTGRVGRLYHAEFLHMDRVRHRLGASRRQRLAAPADLIRLLAIT